MEVILIRSCIFNGNYAAVFLALTKLLSFVDSAATSLPQLTPDSHEKSGYDVLHIRP